jgi:hypothetical protein
VSGLENYRKQIIKAQKFNLCSTIGKHMVQIKTTNAALYLQILAAWKYKPLVEGCRWVYFTIFRGLLDGLLNRMVIGVVG